MKEIWKSIKGYENKYCVSNMGNIKNSNGIILKYQLNHGYARYTLWKNNKSKLLFGHRIVLETFKPNYDNSLQVNHINGNKLDNRLKNLEWVTASENQQHARKNNLFSENGLKKSLSNLIPKEKRKVAMCSKSDSKTIKIFNSVKEASEYIKSPQSASSITKVCRGKEKSCKGYIWKYVS